MKSISRIFSLLLLLAVTAVALTGLFWTSCTSDENNQIVPAASVEDTEEETSTNKIYVTDEQRQQWQKALEDLSDANQVESLMDRYGLQIDVQAR